MYRIPFRALGRPLAGKHGRFNQNSTTTSSQTVEGLSTAPTVEEPSTVEAAPTTDSAEVTAIDEVVTGDEPPAVDDPSTPQTTWEPTWTKSQLLAVAQGMGLPVTSSNTKSEIVAALAAIG